MHQGFLSPLFNAKRPVAHERLMSIDVVRGFAVLGILIMNIQSFGLPEMAYFNPTVLPGSLADAWVFDLGYVFAESKFMTLFSLLFGTSLALMSDLQQSKGGDARRYLVRRHLWLALFGLLHAYLFWQGDVLLIYALCGLLIMGLRNWTPARQIFLASMLLMVPAILFVLGSGAADAEMQANWQPGASALAHEISLMQGSWLSQLDLRVEAALGMHLGLFPLLLIWRVCALMLLGMAFYSLGVTSAQRSSAFYGRLTLLGFAGGLPLTVMGLWLNHDQQWAYAFSTSWGLLPNYFGSLLMAGAYLGAVMWLCQRFPSNSVLLWLSNAGRMALTLYLGQTLIATFLFYGQGLGWFGQLSRVDLIAVCAGIWAVQLIFANVWLGCFRYGPFEWMWRALGKDRKRISSGSIESTR
jgi:uncharacterized protein